MAELGWWYTKGKWYYYKSNNTKLTGWRKINGEWYYFHEDGAMASNEIISGYKINEEGVLVDNEVLRSNKRKKRRE